jgi:hypothetical protein
MRATFLFLFCLPNLLFGQMIIASGTTFSAASGSAMATTSSITNKSTTTDLSNVDLTLAATGTAAEALNTSSPLSLHGLALNNTAPFALVGNWTITNALTFTLGNLVVDKTTGSLTYQGAADVSGNDKSYVNGPLFVQGQAGLRTFPIGNSTGYFPAQLINVEAGDTGTPLGFELIPDPGFLTSVNAPNIFPGHFWELTVGTGTFTSKTRISLSGNQTDTFFTGANASIIERDAAGVDTNLGGTGNNGYFTSDNAITSKGRYYALEKSDDATVKVRVHKLITPDDDGKNDVLYIDGIDALPENRVTILDRWGVPFKKWDKAFVNYPLPANANQPQDGIDFRSLAAGSYIVIVEYTEQNVKKHVQQMISVLK